MLDEVIATLRGAGLWLDARELADALWLAQRLDVPPSRAAAWEEPLRTSTPAPTSQGASTAPPTPGVSAPAPRGATRQVEAPDAPGEVTVATQTAEADAGERGVSHRVPGASALPHWRELLRALRALKRKVATPEVQELDLDATLALVAETRHCLPLFRRGRRVPFELALVVDAGRSMDVWRATLRDLHRFLARAGVFRGVTLWSLHTDDDRAVTLRRGMFTSWASGPGRGLRELCDPRRHRVVLLATDCVSAAWHAGAVGHALLTWGRAHPVALLQVLGRDAWVRTALRHHYDARLSAAAVGTRNAALACTARAGCDAIPLPVLPLRASALASWSALLLGRASASVPGVLFRVRRPPTAATTTMGPERVQRFRAEASQRALQLAALFAAAPVLTLPVMQLIRQSMLPQAGVEHVAEVLLGGLLVEASTADRGARDPEEVAYDFVEGARATLLACVPVPRTLEVMQAVSRVVAAEFGKALDFRAVLRGDLRALQGGAPAGQEFARVTLEILAAVGLRPRHKIEVSAGHNAVDREEALAIDDHSFADDGDRDLSQSSPFRTAGFLPPDSPVFVGRYEEVEFIRHGLRSRSVLIVGARRMGKTSLLRKVHGWAITQDDLLPIFVDLQGVNTDAGFLLRLREGHPSAREAKALLDALRAIVSHAQDSKKLPVLFLNEIDRLLHREPKVFNVCRAMHEADSMRFVMTGYATALTATRLPDAPLYHFSTGMGGRRAVHLGPLTAVEARDLCQLLEAPPLGLTWRAGDREPGIRRLVQISYGLPWLLQSYCQMIVETVEKKRRDFITMDDVESAERVVGEALWEHLQNTLLDQLFSIDPSGIVGAPEHQRMRAGLGSPEPDGSAEVVQAGLLMVLVGLARELYFLDHPHRGRAPVRNPDFLSLSTLGSPLSFTAEDARVVLDKVLAELLLPAEQQRVRAWLDAVDLSRIFRVLTLTPFLQSDIMDESRFAFLRHIVPNELLKRRRIDDPTLDFEFVNRVSSFLEFFQSSR